VLRCCPSASSDEFRDWVGVDLRIGHIFGQGRDSRDAGRVVE
jgi:hypothetical protein